MSRIPEAQLQQVARMYASVEGAARVANAAQAMAQELTSQYLNLVALLICQQIPPGARVQVDFASGEVEISVSQNGVAV